MSNKSSRCVALLLLALAPAAARADVWNVSTFQNLMEMSGRTADLTPGQLTRVEDRKAAYLKTIETYLVRSLGTADPNVLRAFGAVPREYFMYNYEKNASMADLSYESHARPWEIGYGSYISDYRAQAYMTQLLHPRPSDVSLEIGTGSGFQSAILSRLVREAYTIEVITALGRKVDGIYGPLGYRNVHAMVGDGFHGWPGAGEMFDIIIVTCAAPFVPPALLHQLKRNGRMVIPIGQPYKTQYLYVFTKDAAGRIHSRRDMPTHFIPLVSPSLPGP